MDRLESICLALKAIGIPEEKHATVSAQLDKRATQLAEEKGRPYEEALMHLLNLLRQANS
ncbi:hypothetical protein N9B94_00535 [Verrucomicrobia bacterium]|nr:hypothetical protein [Verrucomicrobiota bacterium]